MYLCIIRKNYYDQQKSEKDGNRTERKLILVQNVLIFISLQILFCLMKTEGRTGYIRNRGVRRGVF